MRTRNESLWSQLVNKQYGKSKSYKLRKCETDDKMQNKSVSMVGSYVCFILSHFASFKKVAILAAT